MVYLDGPQIYTCAQCRTHLTSHDEIISKSFHGRHGTQRVALFVIERGYVCCISQNSHVGVSLFALRPGRAYLFDHCVNVTIGPPEDRLLITGLHSVCDIFCKRCKNMVGWTYSKAYETSQKYKEGKFIVEKINLHLDESDYYDVATPAGERNDRFRTRSISWGSAGGGDCHQENGAGGDRNHHRGAREQTVYEYRPSSPVESASAGNT
jgi:Yippee zinc-binding/DNA-binding /Mis18, centromere assembly